MVSVVIPTYNRGALIKHSIDSVLAQTYKNMEVIVVDDASTDNTKQIIDEYQNSKIRYIKSEKKIGANGARNIGIQNAKGEYIAFQDSDDIWEPYKLEKQISFLEMHKEIDVVYSRHYYYLLSGVKKLIPNKNFTQRELAQEIGNTLAKNNVIGTPTLVVRKRCFDEMGMFDEAIPRFQDWEIAIRFAQKYQFGVIDEALVKIYESEKSITRTKGNIWKAMLLIINKHRQFFEEKGTLTKHLGNLFHEAFEEQKIAELFSTLDAELFIQGLYANDIRNANIEKNFNLVKKWMRHGSSDVAVNKFLNQYENRTVAVYGMGELGTLLLDSISEENKQKIKFVIERNKFIACEYEMKVLSDLQDKDFVNLECIIITAVAHEEEIKQSIKKITTVNVLSLSDIV